MNINMVLLQNNTLYNTIDNREDNVTLLYYLLNREYVFI